MCIKQNGNWVCMTKVEKKDLKQEIPILSPGHLEIKSHLVPFGFSTARSWVELNFRCRELFEQNQPQGHRVAVRNWACCRCDFVSHNHWLTAAAMGKPKCEFRGTRWFLMVAEHKMDSSTVAVVWFEGKKKAYWGSGVTMVYTLHRGKHRTNQYTKA